MTKRNGWRARTQGSCSATCTGTRRPRGTDGPAETVALRVRGLPPRVGQSFDRRRSRAAVEFAERLADGQEKPAGIVAMYSAAEEAAVAASGAKTRRGGRPLWAYALLARRAA